MPPLSGKTFLSLFVKGEASTRCNVTTKCISGVRDLKHLFARSWGNVTYWSMSSHSVRKKTSQKIQKTKNKVFQIAYQGSFCGPFLLSKPFWVDGGSCVLEGDSPGDPGGGNCIWTSRQLWSNSILALFLLLLLLLMLWYSSSDDAQDV